MAFSFSFREERKRKFAQIRLNQLPLRWYCFFKTFPMFSSNKMCWLMFLFLQTLLQKEFDLIVNETSYRVEPSEKVTTTTGLVGLSPDEMTRFGDVRALVGQLYEVKLLLRCLSVSHFSICLSVDTNLNRYLSVSLSVSHLLSLSGHWYKSVCLYVAMNIGLSLSLLHFFIFLYVFLASYFAKLHWIICTLKF